MRLFALLATAGMLLVGCSEPPSEPELFYGPDVALVESLAQQERLAKAQAQQLKAQALQLEAQRFGVSAEKLQRARAQLPADQRAKVASLMMVGVRNFDDAAFALDQGVGGIFIGSWTDPALLTQPGRDIAELKRRAGRPFDVSIDAEGGRVQRQPALFGQVPSPREMATTCTPEQTRDIAFQLGSGLAAAGVTVDFAPSLDVDNGPANGAIGDRSFSADPATAARYGAAFGHGLIDAGVRPVYKHFPGHGRASGDSHFQDVTSPPLDSVRAVDLSPYGPALREAPGAVMVGHVRVPGLGDASPSSINPAAYALLRSGDYPGGAPYPGVIYTDDLSGMKAITDRMGTPEAVLAALRAGADCALWISTKDLGRAIDVVNSAVTSGAFPVSQLEDSALRVRLQQLPEQDNKPD